MKRYIPQIPNNDFVYPNNDKVEYDVNIVHEINDNTVYGTVSGLTLTRSGATILLDYNFTWYRNGAEVWTRENGSRGILSIHVLVPGQEYFSPWRMIDSVSTTSTSGVITANILRQVNPSYMGLSSWPSGEYVFEFRFIGLKQNYVVCQTATLAPAPTPTPTPTVFSCTCVSYSITNNSSESQLTYTYQDCDTGVTNEVVLAPSVGESRCACSGSVTITIGSGTILDLGPCAAPPTPTPSQTSTSTPTPTATSSCTYWFLEGSTMSGELLVVQYNDCAGSPQEITIGWNTTPTTSYICAQAGSVVVVEQGLGTSATNTGTPCS